jgi:hypothetical protein
MKYGLVWFGVDKNPFAVNLAKLSLWLATFAKDHPFTFVDHTLRCGDSLVGPTAQQIEAFNWQPKEEGALLRDMPSRLRHILNARAQILDAADETPYETLAQKLAVTEEQMIDLRLAGNLTVFRQLQTSAGGTFVITPVPAGSYTVEVEKSGFKKYTQSDIRLGATERVGLPPITLTRAERTAAGAVAL